LVADAQKHIEEIMTAVMQGPVDVTFNVYADFMDYTSGTSVFLLSPY